MARSSDLAIALSRRVLERPRIGKKEVGNRANALCAHPLLLLVLTLPAQHSSFGFPSTARSGSLKVVHATLRFQQRPGLLLPHNHRVVVPAHRGVSPWPYDTADGVRRQEKEFQGRGRISGGFPGFRDEAGADRENRMTFASRCRGLSQKCIRL